MLVLSRRLHERIQFPGLNITVQVVAIKRGIVRIGIEAPPCESLPSGNPCAAPGTGSPRHHALSQSRSPASTLGGPNQIGGPGRGDPATDNKDTVDRFRAGDRGNPPSPVKSCCTILPRGTRRRGPAPLPTLNLPACCLGSAPPPATAKLVMVRYPARPRTPRERPV